MQYDKSMGFLSPINEHRGQLNMQDHKEQTVTMYVLQSAVLLSPLVTFAKKDRKWESYWKPTQWHTEVKGILTGSVSLYPYCYLTTFIRFSQFHVQVPLVKLNWTISHLRPWFPHGWVSHEVVFLPILSSHFVWEKAGARLIWTWPPNQQWDHKQFPCISVIFISHVFSEYQLFVTREITDVTITKRAYVRAYH